MSILLLQDLGIVFPFTLSRHHGKKSLQHTIAWYIFVILSQEKEEWKGEHFSEKNIQLMSVDNYLHTFRRVRSIPTKMTSFPSFLSSIKITLLREKLEEEHWWRCDLEEKTEWMQWTWKERLWYCFKMGAIEVLFWVERKLQRKEDTGKKGVINTWIGRLIISWWSHHPLIFVLVTLL